MEIPLFGLKLTARTMDFLADLFKYKSDLEFKYLLDYLLISGFDNQVVFYDLENDDFLVREFDQINLDESTVLGLLATLVKNRSSIRDVNYVVRSSSLEVSLNGVNLYFYEKA